MCLWHLAITTIFIPASCCLVQWQGWYSLFIILSFCYVLQIHSMLLSLSERVKKLEGLVEEVISEDELSENEHDTNRNEKKRKIR